jgi:ribosome-binding protein aMBF1 (putative translation factor)
MAAQYSRPVQALKPIGYRRKTDKESRYPVIRRLREVREQHGIDRVTLADAMGYHPVMLGRWERGEATPSLQRLHDWCDALGVRVGVEACPPVTK